MKFQSLSQETQLVEAKSDHRGAKRLGQYRLSALALYWPSGAYLPLGAVDEAAVGTGSLQVKGCCGLALPVPRVSVGFEGKKKNILFDSEKQIETFLSAWRAARAQSGNPEHGSAS